MGEADRQHDFLDALVAAQAAAHFHRSHLHQPVLERETVIVLEPAPQGPCRDTEAVREIFDAEAGIPTVERKATEIPADCTPGAGPAGDRWIPEESEFLGREVDLGRLTTEWYSSNNLHDRVL